MARKPLPIGDCLKPILQRQHAMAAASRLRARDNASTAYRCQDCGGWHVGTPSGRKAPIKTIRNNHQVRST